MKRFFEKLKIRLSLSYGRDALNNFLLIFSIVLMAVNLFLGFFPLWVTAMMLYFMYFFRFFSKNYAARQRELAFYNNIKNKFKQRWSLTRRKWRERKTHKHFRCPKCSTNLRVPKNKGKITVRCPKCGTQTKKKT